MKLNGTDSLSHQSVSRKRGYRKEEKQCRVSKEEQAIDAEQEERKEQTGWINTDMQEYRVN